MSSKRHSYTVRFKLNVIRHAEENNNAKTARKYSISEKLVRDWKKSKELLQASRPTSRSRRHKNPQWPKLETQLKSWIIIQREQGIAVSVELIKLKAREIAAEFTEFKSNFKASSSWANAFMKRHGLSLRAKTSTGQKLPDNWEEKLNSFLNFVHLKITDVEKSQLGNMDEVPVTFDMPSNYTVHPKGSNAVRIKTTGNEKTGFTVVLCVMADGSKLKPMIIFKRKTLPKKEIFPADVIIQANEKGWVDEPMMKIWISEVWAKRPGSFFKPKSMLILDSARAHITDSVKEVLSKNSKLAVIPGGLTSKVQPLDLCVNRSFKNMLRKEWNAWMTSFESQILTKGGKIKRPSYSTIALWVSKSWKALKTHVILNGFRKAQICEGDIFENIQEQEEFEELSSVYDEGFTGFGNGFTDY